jgi:hypothetical protein
MKLFFLPLGEGSLYAAQLVGVGFHSFPSEGAATCETAIKMIHETHEKKQKNQCNLCNLWFHLFHRLRVRPAAS